MKRILELNPRGELEEDANVVQMYGVLSSGDYSMPLDEIESRSS